MKPGCPSPLATDLTNRLSSEVPLSGPMGQLSDQATALGVSGLLEDLSI